MLIVGNVETQNGRMSALLHLTGCISDKGTKD